MDGYWIGVDIGGTKTAVVLCGTAPLVIERKEFATAPEQGPGHALQAIVSIIRQFEKSQRARGAIRAIGVSCGSPLDRIRGVIQRPPNLPTWVDVPITSYLSEQFGGIPCRLENDANAGAVAEYRYGAGRGAETMIFITMGTGFGAGIVIEGKLFHGATDSAGEIGHVRLTPSGPVGYNKAGSVEGWASGGGIAQVAAEAVSRARKAGRTSQLNQLARISAKDVAAAAEAGDEVACSILKDTGEKAGEALAILIDLFNPDRIVLGGIAMRLGDLILAPAREAIAREALPHAAAACQIVTAELGEQIGDVAAICVAQGLDS